VERNLASQNPQRQVRSPRGNGVDHAAHVEPRPISARHVEKPEPRPTTPAPVTLVEDRPTRSLQESVLTLICFNEIEGAEVVAGVKVEHFDEHYRDIAAGVFDYWAQYGKPPGEGHIGDIFDHVLEGRDEKKAESCRNTLISLYRLAPSLNAAYVVSRVGEFLRGQQLKAGMFDLFGRWQQGEDGRNDDMVTILERTLRDLGADNSLAVRCIADVEPESVPWLWYERIPYGGPTLFAGHPGTGKSQLALNIAATVTTAGTWPDKHRYSKPQSVLILSAEDSISHTIRPRLEANGADMQRCFTLPATRIESREGRERWRSFSLAEDLGLLDSQLKKHEDIALVIVDPISAYLGGIDTHRNTDVRSVLAPLADLAARHRVAVIAITHLRKSTDGDAILQATGSIAFTAAARAAYLIAKSKDDSARRLFLTLKNNLADDTTGFAFTIERDTIGHRIETSKVVWEGAPVTITADEALAPKKDDNAPKRSAAETWLRELLHKKPLSVKQIEEDADAAGFSWATIRRAAGEIGVDRKRVGFGGKGGWEWALPADQESED
jgi:hypothetical protein